MANRQKPRDQTNAGFQQVLVGTIFAAAVVGLTQIGLFNISIRAAAVPMLGSMILGPILLGLIRTVVAR